MRTYSKIKNIIKAGGLSLLLKRVSQRLWRNHPGYFAHQMPRGLPSVRVEMKKMTVTKEDVLIAERILTSFHKASNDEKKHAKPDTSVVDAWDDIKTKYHNDFFRILSSNDPRQIADYLSNMHSRKLTYGISGEGEEENKTISSARLRNQKGAIVKDILVSFSEAVGVLPYETIMPYVAKKNIYADSDSLVDAIEKKIGIKIAPPEIDGGWFKLKLQEGAFANRDLWSLYAAWRIDHLVPQNSPICEIGAGLGKVAMYASRFGFHDYSIFDLPLINVVQAWYLIKALPHKKIVLYGETGGTRDSIKIMPYWEFAKIANNRYSLVLNQDSFPEIDKEVVKNYLQKIKKCAKYFLSINQEHQATLFTDTDKRNLVVPNLVEEISGFKRTYRFPFWLRNGYVEELYEINN